MQHVQKAKHNEDFLEYVSKNSGNEYFDWQITIVFYAALHYTKAYLKHHGKHSGDSHEEIAKAILPKNNPLFNDEVYVLYKEMYRSSRDSRYSIVYTSDFQIMMLEQIVKKMKINLKTIKKHYQENGLKIN